MSDDVSLSSIHFPVLWDDDSWEREWEAKLSLPPHHHDHPFGFRFDDEDRYVDVYWGGYEYSIELKRIRTPRQIAQWLHHMGEKHWSGMTPSRVAYFIEQLFSRFDLGLYDTEKSSKPSHSMRARERSKLTPSLRYEILKRDNFTCVACGHSPATGAALHVDHIKPVVSGGETIDTNLRTLCAICNYGKGARPA